MITNQQLLLGTHKDIDSNSKAPLRTHYSVRAAGSNVYEGSVTRYLGNLYALPYLQYFLFSEPTLISN
jgi:hypothetical protein